MTVVRVRVERPGVLVISIHRPETRNAINRAVSLEVASALDRLDEEDDLRVGVLTGAGGTFCSGIDLQGVLAGEVTGIPGRGLAGLTEHPPKKPLIAAVEGHAVGGGFELVLACDLVIAAEGARFGLPEVKRGLVPGSGAALRLPAKIAPGIALELLLTGEAINARRATELGLVNRLVPDGTALEAALEVAETIAGNAPLAVIMAKEIATSAPGWDQAERWDRQRDLVHSVTASDDAAEGVRAFVEKRAPVWRNG